MGLMSDVAIDVPDELLQGSVFDFMSLHFGLHGAFSTNGLQKLRSE